MNELSLFPNWNGLRFGDETSLAFLIDEYVRDGKSFQKWIAVYDIKKKKLCLESSPLKSNRFDFIYNTNKLFVVYIFDCDKVDLTEDNATVFSQDSFYFNDLNEVLLFLKEMNIHFSTFQLTWKVDYPL